MGLTDKEKMLLILLEERKHIYNCINNFYEFCCYLMPEFFTENKQYLKDICNLFQQVTEKKIKKLAISLPPRAGKSLVTSLWCAWMLGKYPHGSIMRNSYGATLAEKFSRDIRDGILQKQQYLSIFPKIAISKKLASIESWALEGYTQPSYFCAGVGGAITGFGTKLAAILDDPIKNIEDALSETIIDKTWDWYTSTHMSRMEKDCANIHIATRWSKKDPIGRLTDPNSEWYDPEFVTYVIPALDDNGNSFCEEIKSTQEYHELKRITEDFIWESEFMQNPVEEKGLLFPIDSLNRFNMSELNAMQPDGIIGYTDTADQGNDYLCSVIGRRYGDYTYIVDVLFTQDGVEITQPLTAKLMIDNKCKIMNVESNNGGKSFADNVQSIIKDIAKALKEDYTIEAKQKAAELDGYYVYHKQTTQNKETRILMSAGYIKQYFYFRSDYEPGSDYDKFMRQLTSYIKLGKNKHDDASDGVTGLAEYMQNNFYIPPVKQRLAPGTYHESELEDKGMSKYEINKLKNGRNSPWIIVA